MRFTVDTDLRKIGVFDEDGGITFVPLYSKEAFELLTHIHMKVGWNQKVPYTYSWYGLPILQLPDDMIRMAEVITSLKPEVIVETGVAGGGSMVFYATLCKAMGVGHVIGVEKGLRCRAQIESHPLSNYITLIEGDSTAPDIVDQVHRLCARTDRVLVILDSCHSYEHVHNELNAYHDLIRPGFYIVATDGNMQDLADVPRGKPEWEFDNPQHAAKEFAKIHKEFIIEQPPRIFNESDLTENITYWPSAWLKRI
jgi:cephalosporin hydroxylase